jgi:YHS domain-containing protein
MKMKMTRYPVCGMQFDEQHSIAASDHNYQTYYFCSLECKEKFDLNPAQFMQSQQENVIGKSAGE